MCTDLSEEIDLQIALTSKTAIDTKFDFSPY